MLQSLKENNARKNSPLRTLHEIPTFRFQYKTCFLFSLSKQENQKKLPTLPTLRALQQSSKGKKFFFPLCSEKSWK